MVPKRHTRRALGKALTKAVVTGLEIYGPHALGFLLFAVPVMVVAGLAHLMLGTPSAISGWLAVAGIAANTTLQLWRSRPHRTVSRRLK